MKKVIVKMLSCVLALVLVAFTGCSGKEPTVTPAGESSQPESTFKDMKGATITIVTSNEAYWGRGEDPQPLQEDWRKQVEKDYNCVIETKTFDSPTVFANVQPSLMAGDKYADLFDSYLWVQEPFRRANLLQDMGAISTLDLTDPLFVKSLTDYYTFNGKTYATHTGEPLAFGMFFNKILLAKLGLENPYDLVEKNEWTFAKFREMCLAANMDLTGDGKMGIKDQYGLGAFAQFDLAMLGANGSYITQQIDKKVEYTLNKPQTIEALTFLNNLFRVDKASYPIGDHWNWTPMAKAFTEGRILFFPFYHTAWADQATMKDDNGFVPLPMGPSTDKLVALADHWTQAFSIPINTTPDEMENMGLILMSMSDRIAEEKTLGYEEMQDRQFRGDAKAVEMIKKIRTNIVFDYAMPTTSEFLPAYNVLITCTRFDGVDPAASLKEIDAMMKNTIKDLYK